MNAPAGQGQHKGCQTLHQGLAFTRGHFRNRAVYQGPRCQVLYVVMRLPQPTVQGLVDQRKAPRYLALVRLSRRRLSQLVQVRAPDNAALRDLVLEQIQGIPGVKTTTTWLVFEDLPGSGTRWS